MTIHAINPSVFIHQSPIAQEVRTSEKVDFTKLLSQPVIDTNHKLNEADKALQDLAAGRAEHLHETMITMEEAKLSFHYLEQIRTRILSAYHDLLREQI